MAQLQRRDTLFVALIAVLTLALAQAAPAVGSRLLGEVAVPSWYTFYVNKLFAGLPLLLSLSGYLWSLGGENFSKKCQRGAILLGKIDRLLYPFWFFSTLLYVVLIGLPNWLAGSCPFTSYTEWILFPRSQSEGFLWFLPALFWLQSLTLVLPARLSIKQGAIAYGVSLTFYALGAHLDIATNHDPLALAWAMQNAHFFFLGALVQKIYQRGVPPRVTVAALLLFHAVLVARILAPQRQPWIHIFALPYFTLLLVVIYGGSAKVGKWIERPPFCYWARYLFPISVFGIFSSFAIGHWLAPLLPTEHPAMPHLVLLSAFLLNLLLPLPFVHLYHKRKLSREQVETPHDPSERAGDTH